MGWEWGTVEPVLSWEQNDLELLRAQRTWLLSKQGKGLATHLWYTHLHKIIIQGPGGLWELKCFSCQLCMESQNSPELIRLALLSFLISLSSGKEEHVGVIPQVGRMEVSKVVSGKSLSCPLCVIDNVAQFGINLQANHGASMSKLPFGQRDQMSGKDTCTFQQE